MRKNLKYSWPKHSLASSPSRHDSPNPVLWLATWGGKIGLSYPLRITTISCSKIAGVFVKTSCPPACSVKIARRWQSFFVIDLKKKNLLSIQQSQPHTQARSPATVRERSLCSSLKACGEGRRPDTREWRKSSLPHTWSVTQKYWHTTI